MQCQSKIQLHCTPHHSYRGVIGRDRMAVGLITNYAISVYHH